MLPPPSTELKYTMKKTQHLSINSSDVNIILRMFLYYQAHLNYCYFQLDTERGWKWNTYAYWQDQMSQESCMEKQEHGCKCRGCSTPHTPPCEWPLCAAVACPGRSGHLWKTPSKALATCGKHLPAGSSWPPHHWSPHSHPSAPPWPTASVQHDWNCRWCPLTWINLLAWEFMRHKLQVSPQCDTSWISFTSQRPEI